MMSQITDGMFLKCYSGTGKTRLIISIILQMLFGQEMKQKLRILVLASSNAAVDIIAKRLLHIRDKMESGM